MLNVYKVKQRVRYKIIYKDKALDCEVFKTIENLIKAITEDESEVKDYITIVIA